MPPGMLPKVFKTQHVSTKVTISPWTLSRLGTRIQNRARDELGFSDSHLGFLVIVEGKRERVLVQDQGEMDSVAKTQRTRKALVTRVGRADKLAGAAKEIDTFVAVGVGINERNVGAADANRHALCQATQANQPRALALL